MTTTIKLQKIGNSIRATIPKEVAEALALKPAEELVVDFVDATVILRKKGVKHLSDLYGALGSRKRVKHWPSPEEIKDIWG